MYRSNWPNTVFWLSNARCGWHVPELYATGPLVAGLVSVMNDFVSSVSIARYSLPKLKPRELQDMTIWFGKENKKGNYETGIKNQL